MKTIINSNVNLIAAAIADQHGQQYAKIAKTLIANTFDTIDTRDTQSGLRSWFAGTFVPQYKAAFESASAGEYLLGEHVVSAKKVTAAKDAMLKAIRRVAEKKGYQITVNMRGDKASMTIKKIKIEIIDEIDNTDNTDDTDEIGSSADNAQPSATAHIDKIEKIVDLLQDVKGDNSALLYIIAKATDLLSADLQPNVLESTGCKLDAEQRQFAGAYISAAIEANRKRENRPSVN